MIHRWIQSHVVKRLSLQNIAWISGLERSPNDSDSKSIVSNSPSVGACRDADIIIGAPEVLRAKANKQERVSYIKPNTHLKILIMKTTWVNKLGLDCIDPAISCFAIEAGRPLLSASLAVSSISTNRSQVNVSILKLNIEIEHCD
jgi:hypothetical protein